MVHVTAKRLLLATVVLFSLSATSAVAEPGAKKTVRHRPKHSTRVSTPPAPAKTKDAAPASPSGTSSPSSQKPPNTTKPH